MSEEKPKNDENFIEEVPQEKQEKTKNEDRNVEWSFDFGTLSESVNEFLSSLAGDEEIRTSEYQVELGDTQTASIKLDLSVGRGTVQALPIATDNLLEATIVHVGEVDFKATGDQHKQVKIKQRTDRKVAGTLRQGIRALASREDLRWDISLAPDVPLELDVNGGAGAANLDLTGLHVRSVDVDNGVGAMTVTLPIQSESCTVDVDGGVGQTRVFVPEGFTGKIDIDGGVGAMDLTVPATGAIQIEVESGIGSVNIPDHFERIKGGGEFLENSGVWQTPGFDLADEHLLIRCDLGVGQLRVRLHDMI